MGKDLVVDIMAVFYIIIVIAQMFHGEGMLRHRFCGVSGDIAPLDVPFGKVLFVQIVGAGSGDADKLQLFRGRDGPGIDLYFVDHEHIGVFGTSGNFLRGGKRIFHDFSKLFKGSIVNIISQCLCV